MSAGSSGIPPTLSSQGATDGVVTAEQTLAAQCLALHRSDQRMVLLAQALDSVCPPPQRRSDQAAVTQHPQDQAHSHCQLGTN